MGDGDLGLASIDYGRGAGELGSDIKFSSSVFGVEKRPGLEKWGFGLETPMSVSGSWVAHA